MPSPESVNTSPLKSSRDVLVRLQQQGYLDDDQIKVSLLRTDKWEREGVAPHETVARCKLKSQFNEEILNEEFLTNWLAKETGQDVVVIDPLKVDVEKVTDVMSHAFAERHGILAIDVNKIGIVIAQSWPDSSGWLTGLEHVVRKPIRTVLANPVDIRRFQNEFYNLSQSVRGAHGEQSSQFGVDNFEQLVELGKSGELDANDRHVVKIVDWLLQYAFDQRASDIHIEPRRDIGKVRFRIDGLLHTVYEFPSTITSAVIARLKILGRMDVAERRKPLDGRIKTKTPEGDEVELRLSTLPTAFGEKMVARIFDPEVVLKNFSELGLTQKDEETWVGMVKQPNGIVLVTGPTGSGKTTTLYTSLKMLAKPEVNVCTIEDPIEMVEPSFNQVQVKEETGVEFGSGVRALLRQDPDIIMIGEIRDKETADMAVQAALTGHLVLSTLHTNDAPTAISRIMELGVPPFLLNATLLGVMAQRLVRTLCIHCKRAVDVSDEDWHSMVTEQQLAKPEKVCEPVGCRLCRETGFLGRQGIYEMMPFSSELAELVNDNASLEKLKQQALAEGMNTLLMAGAQKVAEGITTIGEVIRVAGLARS
ncbi:MAG TPA: type II/IV secretion system protein [Aeromonadales bacterium]|nr:type II/IV secretion system protein [Aeromonadales bacterium]